MRIVICSEIFSNKRLKVVVERMIYSQGSRSSECLNFPDCECAGVEYDDYAYLEENLQVQSISEHSRQSDRPSFAQ